MSGTALITGASAGLGADFARLFAADGHDVVLVARRKQKLEEIASSLQQAHGIKAHVFAADLADPTSPDQILEFTRASGIDIECLVNNAGFGSNGAFVDQDIARELSMINVNISALVHLTHLYLPAMLQRGNGRVLNIASTAGFQAGPYMATYYATKAFVIHFSEALWHELEGTGVTVTAHCPGPTATEFSGIAGNDRASMFKGGGASSEKCAQHAYDAMRRGKRIAVHGVKNKFGVVSQRLVPRGLVHRLSGKLNRP